MTRQKVWQQKYRCYRNTDTATLCPLVSIRNFRMEPFISAVYAIVKLSPDNCYEWRLFNHSFDFAGIFERLGDDPKMGQAFAALLGALYAQERLGIPAIGGRTACPAVLKI